MHLFYSLWYFDFDMLSNQFYELITKGPIDFNLPLKPKRLGHSSRPRRYSNLKRVIKGSKQNEGK